MYLVGKDLVLANGVRVSEVRDNGQNNIIAVWEKTPIEMTPLQGEIVSFLLNNTRATLWKLSRACEKYEKTSDSVSNAEAIKSAIDNLNQAARDIGLGPIVLISKHASGKLIDRTASLNKEAANA